MVRPEILTGPKRKRDRFNTVRPGVFSLFDFALNWCFSENLMLFHSGRLRGAIAEVMDDQEAPGFTPGEFHLLPRRTRRKIPFPRRRTRRGKGRILLLTLFHTPPTVAKADTYPRLAPRASCGCNYGLRSATMRAGAAGRSGSGRLGRPEE